MSEKDIQLLVMCLKEYIKNIDGERFKQLVDEQHLDINLLPPYKRDVFYRFIKNHYSKQDILSLYYFNDEIGALECFIDMIDSKYQ